MHPPAARGYHGYIPRESGILPRPVFGHGQLYVALSRSGNPPSGHRGVRIVAPDTPDGKQGRFEGHDGVYTRNVVGTAK